MKKYILSCFLFVCFIGFTVVVFTKPINNAPINNAPPSDISNLQIDCTLLSAAAAGASYFKFLGDTKADAKEKLATNMQKAVPEMPVNVVQTISSEIVESTWQALPNSTKMSESRADELSDEFGEKVKRACEVQQQQLKDLPTLEV